MRQDNLRLMDGEEDGGELEGAVSSEVTVDTVLNRV